MKFSVLMTVYEKEKPDYFRASLQSILVDQTKLPDQFVIVYDGPLTDELLQISCEYKQCFPNEYTVVSLPKNVGQGVASKVGIEKCRYELIARMDSDDISYPTRFEKELAIFENDLDIDVVGGFISEFKFNPLETVGTRKTEETHQQIVNDFHRRNPMNNVTVMYKKQALIDIGGYSDLKTNEDFNIYVRFLLAGKKFYNIQEPLVNVRVGNNMIDRRMDMNIYYAWKKNQKLLYEGKIISNFELIVSNMKCYCFVKCPKWVKKLLYKHVLRSR